MTQEFRVYPVLGEDWSWFPESTLIGSQLPVTTDLGGHGTLFYPWVPALTCSRAIHRHTQTHHKTKWMLWKTKRCIGHLEISRSSKVNIFHGTLQASSVVNISVDTITSTWKYPESSKFITARASFLKCRYFSWELKFSCRQQTLPVPRPVTLPTPRITTSLFSYFLRTCLLKAKLWIDTGPKSVRRHVKKLCFGTNASSLAPKFTVTRCWQVSQARNVSESAAVLSCLH